MADELRISELVLRNFRSYERLRLELPPGLTVLAGPNGVGKTNLLEAAAWTLMGASPRTSSEASCVREGEAFFRLTAVVQRGARRHTTAVTLQPGRGKRLLIDDVAAASVDAFAQPFPCVVFLPERLLVVRGAPARRRAALDRVAARLDHRALDIARSYGRAVAQRNAVLRQAKVRDVSRSLEPWTQQVVELGQQLREARSRALTALRPRFARRFLELTGFDDGGLELDVRGPDIGQALDEQRQLDLRRGTTSAGPHLDDLGFRQGQRDLRAFGSTGEQRAALLAWSLAEADAITDIAGVQPVLLLDEPYAELDEQRRDRLTSSLRSFAQAVVTTTEPPAPAAAAGTVLAVSSGAVAPWTNDPPS